uniref:hypothetical protein n=1 Tax=Ideonella sp. B508-1 TaxID=137716 RepID=UPI00131F2924
THWRGQINFSGYRLGDAIRIRSIDQSIGRHAGDQPNFPQFAYFVPPGTRERLTSIAGLEQETTDDIHRKLELCGPAGIELSLRIRAYHRLSPKLRCEVLSSLMCAALYRLAFELEEGNTAEGDPGNEYEAWYIFQVARLLQRFGGVYGSPAPALKALAKYAPLVWQRRAATAQLIVWYSRAVQSAGRCGLWISYAKSLLEQASGEDRFLDAIWASRLWRAIALGERTRECWDACDAAVEQAGIHHLHAKFSQADSSHTAEETEHLIEMNERLVLEVNIKRLRSGSDIFEDRLQRLDPGCADVHCLIGYKQLARGERAAAIQSLSHAYSLGTLRSASAAIALARLFEGEESSQAEAIAWKNAATAMAVPSIRND